MAITTGLLIVIGVIIFIMLLAQVKLFLHEFRKFRQADDDIAESIKWAATIWRVK